MTDGDWMAERFEQHRPRLRAVAYRMLGSASEADDAVQEAWLRFSRSDTTSVADLGAWLTTVVSRVCLNILQSRRSRPEVPLDPGGQTLAASAPSSDPEAEALLADSIGAALMVVLDTLAPPARVAFVLHDMFGVPFEDIGAIVGRSPAATRQLASRARLRVQGRGKDRESDGIRDARLVDAFLAAARKADFQALLAVLDPDVVLKPDQVAVKMGASPASGAQVVASWFTGRAGGAQPATVNRKAGAVWMPGGELRVVFVFTTVAERIVEIELVAAPDRIAELDVAVQGNPVG